MRAHLREGALVPDRRFTDEELDAAIEQLIEPGRLRAGQDLVMRAAPSLQRVLAAALADGGWFDSAHDQAVREAVAESGGEARLRAVRTLMEEETRLGMLVGVAVGFELAGALEGRRGSQDS
jgi:hypothetical protein